MFTGYQLQGNKDRCLKCVGSLLLLLTVHLQGTRYKVTYDGMMHYLEIPRARETDVGQVRVVARNIEGEAEASTTLNVLPHDDWRSKLRQAPKGRVVVLLSYCFVNCFTSALFIGYDVLISGNDQKWLTMM